MKWIQKLLQFKKTNVNIFSINRHHNRVHRDNRTTANSIATINSVAAGDMGSSMNANSDTGNVYDASGAQVCDLR